MMTASLCYTTENGAPAQIAVISLGGRFVLGAKMGRHKPFTDAAGFTRHCWECKHAKDWTEESAMLGYRGICELTLRLVWKYDSPNNQCCHLPPECEYERN